MTNFLFVDYTAIQVIVSNRQYQARSFDIGNKLLSFLKDESIAYEDQLICGFFDEHTKGKIIVGRGGKLTHGLIFDFETLPALSKHPDGEVVSIFQKVLKFSMRYWAGNTFSASEKIIDNDHAIVFPFNFSSNAFRVILDRNPLEKRSAKREYKLLQVFNSGHGIFDLAPSYTNLRKLMDAKDRIASLVSDHFSAKFTSNETIGSTSLLTQLSNVDFNIEGGLNFEEWLQYLTTNQKEFVLSKIDSPQRLEGAAGTGKTLSLILKAYYFLRQSISNRMPCRILFITHSSATKDQIRDRFVSLDAGIKEHIDGNDAFNVLAVKTLTDWCVENLGHAIDDDQLLERDAQDSKTHQFLLIEEVYNNVLEEDFQSYEPLLSDELKMFLRNTDKEGIIEMIQFEVGVTIKGKAEESFETYLKLLPHRSPYGIPAKNRSDLDLLYLIYTRYKDRLLVTDQYDVDDIVLTSIGILRTPVWRRRRKSEGYDLVIIDETHLFNFNELSIFHNLLKDESSNRIVFAIDKSQAVGDRGLTNDVLVDQLKLTETVRNDRYNTVFRSSPDIINLAYNVLTSGAGLFQGNFENPIDENVEFPFTSEDEQKARKPFVVEFESTDRMISDAFELADLMVERLSCNKHQIILIACSDEILNSLERFANRLNKPYEVLKQRGDYDTLRKAQRSNRFVIGGIDYVGGLEFYGVILVGADKGRVPPADNESAFNFHFVNYAWHNRLYVAITRAKYMLAILHEKARGLSPIFSNINGSGTLDECSLQQLKKME